MGKSKKDGRKKGGHRNTQGKEYWSSRPTHYPMGKPGRVVKQDTHRAERRAAKELERHDDD